MDLKSLSLKQLYGLKEKVKAEISRRETNESGIDWYEFDFEERFTITRKAIDKVIKNNYYFDKPIEIAKMSLGAGGSLRVVNSVRYCKKGIVLETKEYDSYEDPDKHYDSDCYDSDGEFVTQVDVLNTVYLTKKDLRNLFTFLKKNDDIH